MSTKAILLRSLIGLAFTFWVMQVLAVAVFAVGDRYSGATAIFMGSLVMIGGMLPVAFLFYLFQGQDRRHRSAAPSQSVESITPASPLTATLAEPLSEREMDVISLLAEGYSNKEIGLRLSISPGTVKTHVNNINRKLNTSNRTQIVARARDAGLI